MKKVSEIWVQKLCTEDLTYFFTQLGAEVKDLTPEHNKTIMQMLPIPKLNIDMRRGISLRITFLNKWILSIQGGFGLRCHPHSYTDTYDTVETGIITPPPINELVQFATAWKKYTESDRKYDVGYEVTPLLDETDTVQNDVNLEGVMTIGYVLASIENLSPANMERPIASWKL